MTGVQSEWHGGGFLGSLVDDRQQLQFPAGLRVLVVDDDLACLTILSCMLKRCSYQVTTCCQASVALSLLRQRKGGFDVMISDVHMPDMDGYKLLELVGLEMDLPVIMVSVDGRTSAVMKGIQHGACDYLVKPVRMEELQNIWQHVVRKKWQDSKEVDLSGSLEDSACCQEVVDEPEANASSTNDIRDDNRTTYKNKRDAKENEDDGERGNNSAASKKSRIVWSEELHQQFVNAVNKLGVDKAVPKRILDLMNVPGLTRETVASHLQKFRQYVKRFSKASRHQSGNSSILFPPLNVNPKIELPGGYNSEALDESDQISPQTLAALHAELLNRPSGGIVLPSSPAMPQSLLQSSTQRSVDIQCVQEVAYGLPILECQPSNLRDFNGESHVSLKENSSCSSTGMLQHQGHYASIQESNHAITVRTSSLTAASQESTLFSDTPFQAQRDSAVVSCQSSTGFGGSKVLSSVQNHDDNNSRHPDYTPACGSIVIPSSAHSSPGQGLITGGFSFTNIKPGVTSTSLPWSLTDASNTNILLPCNPSTEVDLCRSLPNSTIICNRGIDNERLTLPVRGQEENFGFVGEGNCITSCFDLDYMESPCSDIFQRSMGTIISNMPSVKQEILFDFADSSEAEATWRMMFPSN